MTVNATQLIKKSALFWFFFIVAFLAVPYSQLGHLSRMPGDIGDARLNNYFLENIYQYIQGNVRSLIHPDFFYPFPYVQGFSDNLFGAAPAYLVSRLLTAESDTAYQIWYLFGYFANYIAAYYALRKLNASVIASISGALIFAFSLPVNAHSGHAQLHYRFGVPLAITMFTLFLERKRWQYFAVTAAWLVWQFYCTIYIGFFLLSLLAAMFCIYAINSVKAGAGGFKTIISVLFNQFFRLSRNKKLKLAIVLIILFLLMVLLFYPYFQVSVLYDAKRHWSEISTMLPRPQSYFLADNSKLWVSQAKAFANLPMRHEHQMFIGAVPLLLAIGGYVAGRRQNSGLAFSLISGSLVLLVLVTICLGGFSLWYVFAKLPLASAIRAITRIILVFLFPIAFLSAFAVDRLIERAGLWRKVLVFTLIMLMLFEFSAVFPGTSAKEKWRKRMVACEAVFPQNLPQDAILFFAQREGPFYADEIDAMWCALKHKLPTMNGYSGLYPRSASVLYGNDCTELPKRVLSYLEFSGQVGNNDAYFKLMKRVVPIGFSGCNPDWLVRTPSQTSSDRIYSADELRKLSYEYVGREKIFDNEYVTLRIVNKGNLNIAASSAIDKAIRLSWRFIDVAGNPVSGWDMRKDLPFDIPANDSLDVTVLIDPKSAERAGKLQISMVQEHVFWGHDIGIAPLELNWAAE
jgi:hypothetical protein